MPNTHIETKILPYTAQQMYDLVVGVQDYQDFLPWCTLSRVYNIRPDDHCFDADLVIGYKMIRERFTSRVTYQPSQKVHVQYLRGPMKYLNNEWRFTDVEHNHCRIDFFVEFEFKNRVLEQLMGLFFNEITRRMVFAFEKRANEVYSSNSSSLKHQ
jgi:coenzyme Q-binding protein COQ10